MKNINKLIQQKVSKQSKKAREESAGGKKMMVHAVSDPRFSRVNSKQMFQEKCDEPEDEIEEAKEHEKETSNPSKSVKRLKKMKNPGKKGK